MAHHTLRAVVVLALVSSAAITVLAQRTGDQTYFLIAKPDGEIERASTSARGRSSMPASSPACGVRTVGA